MKCRHRVVASSWRSGIVVGRRCWHCGGALSLGPARDDGPFAEAVAIEIRAAELSDLFASHATSMEASGWQARRFYGSTSGIDDPQWQAGYLAAAIWSHDEEQP